MAKIFVTHQIPGKALEELQAEHEVEVYEVAHGERIPREVLLQKIKGVDAVLCLLTEQIDAEFFDAAGEQLKIVANYAVGFDNVDVEEANKRKVWVTNTPSSLGDAVAEFAVALMLALSRHIVAADKFTRAGKYKVWEPDVFLGQDLTGKTLGVVGAGTIGSVVAKRAKGVFEMRVVYTGSKPKPDFEEEIGGAEFMEFDQLLKESDVITMHVPLTPDTRHMLSTEQFGMMKSNVIILNTSRGPVIDECALIEALKQHKVWGVGLDVYEGEDPEERERLPLENWNELISFDNVIMTPHIASATLEAREEMTRLAVDNLQAALRGEEPPCLVPGCKE